MSKFKVLTLAEMIKNQNKLILEESLRSTQHYIFGAVNGNMPHVDLPFVCHNERDVEIFEQLLKAFRAKRWDISELTREPVTVNSPVGVVSYTRIIYRVQLKKPAAAKKKPMPLVLAGRQAGEKVQ